MLLTIIKALLGNVAMQDNKAKAAEKKAGEITKRCVYCRKSLGQNSFYIGIALGQWAHPKCHLEGRGKTPVCKETDYLRGLWA